MDARSERSVCSGVGVGPIILPEEVTCFLEGAERGRFPTAELCAAGCALGGMAAAAGTVLLVLHFTLEQTPGRTSVAQGLGVNTWCVGVALVSGAAALLLIGLAARALWWATEVLELASRYREHRELCAYEDLRQSIRSSRSVVYTPPTPPPK